MKITTYLSKRLFVWIFRDYRSGSDRVIWAALAFLLSFIALPAQAQESLAQQPLFLGTNVEPNVLLIFDDSGSMNWEVLTRDVANDGRFTGTQPEGEPTDGELAAAGITRADIGEIVNRHNFPPPTPNLTDPYDLGNPCFVDLDNDPDTTSGQFFTGYTYGVDFSSNSYPHDFGGDVGLVDFVAQARERDCDVAADRSWRFRNYDFNRMYFNYDQVIENLAKGEKTYKPWVGVDSNGQPFGDIDITNAPANPYNPDNPTDSIDLTTDGGALITGPGGVNTQRVGDGNGFSYYLWNDDGNGFFENGEQEERFIKDEPLEVQQEFANWFSYYRKREYVAKNAYGRVIDEAEGIRVGLVTLPRIRRTTNDDGSVDIDVDGSTNLDENLPIFPIDNEANQTNKDGLMHAMYSVVADRTTRGTPLRDALDQAGKYLSCEDSVLFSTDALSDVCPADALTVTDSSSDITLSRPQISAEERRCQQNIVIAMTDGFYNGLNFTIDNHDGGTPSDWDGRAYADNNSNTLADIAMFYYENDINATGNDGDNLVPSSQIEEDEEDERTDFARNQVPEPSHQHIITNAIAFGVQGTIPVVDAEGNRDTRRDNDPGGNDAFLWPNPNDPTDDKATSNQKKIDDLHHASFNGRGEYSEASNTDELVEALERMLGGIGDTSISVSRVSFFPSESAVFCTSFDSSKWTGNVVAMNTSARCILDENTDPNDILWDATEELETQLEDNKRIILTHNGTNGIPFVWDELTAEQKLDLCDGVADCQGVDLDRAQARLEYFRGDRSQERGEDGAVFNFRKRRGLLGDIINAGALFVGEPIADWPDTGVFAAFPAYSEFKTIQRQDMVYVSANDGMLHGFNADNGQETLVYIPGSVFSANAGEGLHSLTDPDYVHRYYVDLRPVITDAIVNDEWASVLIGGLRAGGRGYFALDVTNPATEAPETSDTSVVLWEFTDADDGALGHTFSRPTIALLENGKWAAIFGNGYGSGEGAHLFIAYLDGGTDGLWTKGSDYIRIPVDTDDSGNGLSEPTVVDLDGNGTADQVYAGDLNGNMWVFDIFEPDEPPVTRKLFTTQGRQQPITASPAVIKHPTISDLDDATNPSNPNSANVLVMFGTGQFMFEGDQDVAADEPQQALYGVWDIGGEDLTLADLAQQTVTVTPNDPDTREFLPENVQVVCYTTEIDPEACADNQHFGWYVPLPELGERTVTKPTVRSNVIFFQSITPSVIPCDDSGSSWFIAVSALTGADPQIATFDINGDGQVNETDLLERADEGDEDSSDRAVIARRYDGIAGEANITGDTLSFTTTKEGLIGLSILSDENAIRGRLSWEALGN